MGTTTPSAWSSSSSRAHSSRSSSTTLSSPLRCSGPSPSTSRRLLSCHSSSWCPRPARRRTSRATISSLLARTGRSTSSTGSTATTPRARWTTLPLPQASCRPSCTVISSTSTLRKCCTARSWSCCPRPRVAVIASKYGVPHTPHTIGSYHVGWLQCSSAKDLASSSRPLVPRAVAGRAVPGRAVPGRDTSAPSVRPCSMHRSFWKCASTALASMPVASLSGSSRAANAAVEGLAPLAVPGRALPAGPGCVAMPDAGRDPPAVAGRDEAVPGRAVPGRAVPGRGTFSRADRTTPSTAVSCGRSKAAASWAGRRSSAYGFPLMHSSARLSSSRSTPRASPLCSKLFATSRISTAGAMRGTSSRVTRKFPATTRSVSSFMLPSRARSLSPQRAR
eukprot:m.26376 g.26376  ORF g.26376 m.26376 type:complete len:392 (+) comp4281_c0_seq2:296-1471(+)